MRIPRLLAMSLPCLLLPVQPSWCQQPSPPRPPADPAAAPPARTRAKAAWARVEADWVKAFDAAADWLVRHQEPDGHWDCAHFMDRDPPGEREDGAGNEVNNVDITGIALLVLAADGSTAAQGRCHDAIAKACAWLGDQQRADGLFGLPSSQGFFYSHCAASWGLADCAHGANDEAATRVLRKAVDYMLQSRKAGHVWRYQPQDEDGDSSITSWAVHALLAARDAGVVMPETQFRDACAWYDHATDPKTGSVGYQHPGEGSARRVDVLDQFPQSCTEALTAEMLSFRLHLGQDMNRTPACALGIARLHKLPPSWDPKAGTIDTMYWCFGASVMQRLGGEGLVIWRKALRDNVVKRQNKAGPSAGSWDVVDPWSADGGRVLTTCMLALALAAPWREAR